MWFQNACNEVSTSGESRICKRRFEWARKRPQKLKSTPTPVQNRVFSCNLAYLRVHRL